KYKKSLKIQKIVMTWFPTLKIANYKPEVFPVFSRFYDNLSIFGVPTIDGSMIKVGSVDTFGAISDPDQLERDITLEELESLREKVKKSFPGLSNDPTKISIHMDAYSDDHNAIIGKVEKNSNVYVMGGFSGHGFKLAPVMGEMAAQLLVNGKSDLLLDIFNSERSINKGGIL